MADPADLEIVLVDATNLMRSTAWCKVLLARGIEPLDLEHASAALIDAVASWAGAAGVVVELIFDGIGPDRSVGDTVTVIRAGDADRRVASRARTAAAAGRRVRIVTDDRMLAGSTGLLPATTTASFVAMMAACEHPADGAIDAEQPAARPGSPVLESIDDSVRELLERMRRGEP